MATNIELPQLGESVHEGTLGKWLKKVGDKVDLYEPLVEITTDKVDTEMPSPVAGTLLEILAPEGATVAAGAAIAIVGEPGEKTHGGAPPEKAQRQEEKQADMPGTTEAQKSTDGQPAQEPAASNEASPAQRLSPVVARMVSENNLDPRRIKGTGDGGRITKQDVLAYLEERRPAAAAPAVQAEPAAGGEQAQAAQKPEAAPAAPQPQPAPAAPGGREETIPLTTIRRTIAEHMVRSRHTAAHVTAFVEVDMTQVVRLRDQHKEEFERRSGVHLTYVPFVAMAVLRAIRDFPIINSTMSEDAIVIKNYVNLGVAVALQDGLIVPVVKNADEKNLQGLARAIDDLARRAREKKLNVDDVQGGTFTITNPGSFGTILGTPIINQPQAAILDMEAIVKRPVVITSDGVDSIAIRSMMYLGLSFDHRILDGAIAAQFLGKMKTYLEEAEFSL